MAGKNTRSQNSANAIPVANLPNHHTNSIYKNNTAKTSKELKSMTKKELKSECRQRGRKTSGSKLELIERLGYKMSTSVKRKDANEASQTSNGSNKQLEMKGSGESEKHNVQNDIEVRKSLVLWKRPFSTLEYSIRECVILLATYGKRLFQNKRLLVLLMISTLFISILMNTNGPHQSLVQAANKKIFWCLYWIGLGVLSSVGLGTGLHTFILYLGPHIARVTLAAYECNSVDFPEPPYPDDIICPADEVTSYISIFSIMAKVRLEAMCWGAGTALGELPPYFMARAARLSGIDPEDEDDELKEFEELQKKAEEHQELTIIQKGKLFVEDLVKKVGFFGILACASIPNPLFDLAGITCGHFLVPFWTFFGATLIGKAIIKMHIQKLFVIIAFDETLINIALSWLKVVPVVGEMLQVPFKAFLDGQKTKLHKKGAASDLPDKGNILGTCFEIFVMVMVLYFVVSILNSLAQSYHKRISKKKSDKISKD